jgi:Galactose oxidase, central domain
MKNTRNIARHALGLTLVLIVATFVLEPVALARVDPSWIPTGSLNIPRYGHTATLLPNGKVLVVGGRNGNSPSNFLNSAELYDPATGN